MDIEDIEQQSEALGSELLRHAGETEGHSRYVRGRVSALFPYIYEASKKLSLRAISRWLASKGSPVSVPTLSRALSNPETHWEEYSEIIEPEARIVQRAYGYKDFEFLFQEMAIFDMETAEVGHNGVEPLILDAGSQSEAEEEFYRVEVAKKYLLDEWFCLQIGTRLSCRKYLVGGDVEAGQGNVGEQAK